MDFELKFKPFPQKKFKLPNFVGKLGRMTKKKNYKMWYSYIEAQLGYEAYFMY